MPCQCFFVLSDSGVPRTFVDDCICVTRRDYDMFSGKIQKRPCVFFFICDGTAFGSRNKCFRVLNTSRCMILHILGKHAKAQSVAVLASKVGQSKC